MDKCDASRFSNSSMQKWSSQGWRHPVELESKQAKDILKLLEDHVLDKLLRWQDSWRVDKICLVDNKTSKLNFLEKRYELSKESTETYAFGVTQTEQDSDRICSSCDFTCQSLNVPLGDVNQGVNVCLFSDVLLQWSERKDFRQPCIIVYKILKGRCKAVAPRTSTKDPYATPTPNMECHISSGTPNTTEPIFRQLSKSQIFLFEYDEAAVPSRHPRHCLPYATISLTSKTGRFGEKENGNVIIVPIKACEKPPQEKPTQGTRMKLSDRFSNIAPSHAKLDDPKLEELRQAALNKLAKLKAVRNERFNNALLGFGSSSEDELLQSSPKPLGTGKNTTKQKSQFSCSSSNVANSGIGRLKITITNTGSLSENSDGGTSGKTTQQKEKNAKHCEAKFNNKERHERFKDNCSLTKEKSTEKRAHSSDFRSGGCHPKSKVLKSSEECPPDPSKSSPKMDKVSQCSRITGAGDGGSQGHSRGSRQGICSQVRKGYSRGRGRVRYHCPEYFKSDDESRAFDAEKDLYEAALSRSSSKLHHDPSEQQGTQLGTTTCPSHTRENMKISNTSYEPMQGDAPFIRLESRNHNPYEGADLEFGRRRHDSNIALPNLDRYRKSLQLEPISPEFNVLTDGHLVANADNLEILDMEIDESSRESWQRETKQNCYQRSLSDNTWANHQVSAFQTGATLPVIDIPASAPQNSPPASVSHDIFLQPTHNTTNPASPTIGGPRTQNCYQRSLSDNTWANQQVSAFQTAATLPVIDIPASAPQNSPPASVGHDTFFQPTHNTTNPASATIGGPRTQSLLTSSRIQEAVKMLEDRIQQARTADQKEVYQLALQSFLEKCASEQGSCCPTTSTQTSTDSCTQSTPTNITLCSPTTVDSTATHVQQGGTELVTCKTKQKPCDEKVTSCRKDKGTRKPDDPRKPKTKRLFYGRPMIANGKPHEILMENIPGQRQPVDPRPALSVWFDRKYEIDLKTLSWNLDEKESKSSKGEEDCVGSSKAVGPRRKSNGASSPSNRDPRLKKSPKSDQKADLSVPKPSVPESDTQKCDSANFPTAELQQTDSVQKLPDVKKEDASTKQKQTTEGSPTTQFLQKLQHVSCLAPSVTKPELVGKPQPTGKESAAPESEVPDKHVKLSREAETSEKHDSGSSSCSTFSPVSVSSSERVHKVLTSEKSSEKRTHRRERSSRRSWSEKDSLHRKRSPYRRSSHRHRSRSKSRSPHRHRISHRRRSSELRNRSPPARAQKKQPSHLRREDKLGLFFDGPETSYCGPLSTPQPTGKHFLSDITSELSSLQSSTNKATEKMSKFPTDKKYFKQECFSCLHQYNQLWLKATKALSTLKQRDSTSEPDVQKHEDVVANIHLQLESLAKYFHQNDLEKAGIEDWNFRPLSGVPGLSEKAHLTVLRRLKEKHIQPGSDLMRLLCRKIHLLDTKLASLSPFARVLGKSQLQPSADVPTMSSLSSVQPHHSADLNFSKDVQRPRPIETVVSSRLQSHSVSQQSDRDVRHVVLRNIKDETQAGGEQRGLAVPNPTPQNRWCAIVKQGSMDFDKRA